MEVIEMTVQTKQECKMDMQELMRKYQQLATPGAPHKLLSRMEGSWNTKMQHWMDPDQPPTESEGTCERKMIFGGRYLQEEYKGDMMGTPFNGIGYMGYDNHTKKYVMTWFDSMSTGIYFFEGDASPDGKTITLNGRYNDAIKGPVKWRIVNKIGDDNTQFFEMTMIDSKNNEEKCAGTYTRRR
jgi:hypothetical protein